MPIETKRKKFVCCFWDILVSDVDELSIMMSSHRSVTAVDSDIKVISRKRNFPDWSTRLTIQTHLFLWSTVNVT